MPESAVNITNLINMIGEAKGMEFAAGAAAVLDLILPATEEGDSEKSK